MADICLSNIVLLRNGHLGYMRYILLLNTVRFFQYPNVLVYILSLAAMAEFLEECLSFYLSSRLVIFQNYFQSKKHKRLIDAL